MGDNLLCTSQIWDCLYKALLHCEDYRSLDRMHTCEEWWGLTEFNCLKYFDPDKQ